MFVSHSLPLAWSCSEEFSVPGTEETLQCLWDWNVSGNLKNKNKKAGKKNKKQSKKDNFFDTAYYDDDIFDELDDDLYDDEYEGGKKKLNVYRLEGENGKSQIAVKLDKNKLEN